MVTKSKLTVVSYCHEAHEPWIPFWVEQIKKQTLDPSEFTVAFIFHNWQNKVAIARARKVIVENLKNVITYEFYSQPVIGEVIDYGCSILTQKDGLQQSEFFAHWDVDDVIHPERLALQLAFLNDNPDIDFLGTRMVGFNGQPTKEMMQLNYVQPNEPNLHVKNNDEIRDCLVNRNQNCLGHTTMVYRPEVMQALGGFSRSDVKLDGKSPDFETWKKAIIAGYKFYRLPELCALWRLDSSSIRL